MERKRRSSCFAEDVLVEILSRVPMKSLLRCMCVSKEWHALIKSSYFAVVHLQRWDSNNLLLLSTKAVSEDLIYTISLLRNESTNLSLDLPFLNSPSMQWLIPVGSSSGLVCLKISDLRVMDGPARPQYIVVWNPVTQQFRFLPDSRTDHHLLGFEFFHDIRGYKVVSILQPGHDNTIRAKVFTRSTNSWREVKSQYCCSSRPEILGTSRSITLNGVLYSPLFIERRRSHVLSFNLRDEVFDVIPIPLPDSSGRITKLLTWKNSVAFLGGREGALPSELWVMTEEPSQITWVKQFILEPSPLPRDILGSWKDEYLLGDYSVNNLHCYDPASNKLKRLPQHDYTHGYSYEKAINYVESLVFVD